MYVTVLGVDHTSTFEKRRETLKYLKMMSRNECMYIIGELIINSKHTSTLRKNIKSSE